jgi:serine/threonine protein kinase
MVDDAQRRLKLCMPEGMTLVRAIGESPLSEVFLVAKDDGLLFALKVMRESVAKDPRIVERWNRETKTLVELEHTNLVHCFGSCEIEGRPALILEYISGGSLRDQLDGEPLSWEKACRYGIQISRALDYLHRHGVVHRDVKPHNILLHPIHGAVLADLGLVLREDDPTLTRHGAALGSPAYMSPEQSINPSDVRSQADIYSLGATLYHAISGRPPFTGKGVGEVIHRVMHEQPDELDEEIPDSLAQVIAVAMNKDEEQRYDRARRMGSDLGRVVLGYKPHLTTLLRGRVLRRRLWASAAMAVLSYSIYIAWPSAFDQNPDSITVRNEQISDVMMPQVPSSDFSNEDDGNQQATPESTLSFDEWVADYRNRFSAYLQSQNLLAATELLNAAKANIPAESQPVFMREVQKWVLQSQVQLAATAERIAAIAINLLEQIADDQFRLARKGKFDEQIFLTKVQNVWKAAGVDIDQLAVAVGHPDVKARLDVVKNRLIDKSRFVNEQMQLLDEIIIRTRPLLHAADFDAAYKQFALLDSQFADSNERAQMFARQAKRMSEIKARLVRFLERRVGRQVTLTMRNGDALELELQRGDGGGFFVNYLEQAEIEVSIFSLDSTKLLELIEFGDDFDRAHLLWCSSQFDKALFAMGKVAKSSAKLADPWIEHWVSAHEISSGQSPAYESSTANIQPELDITSVAELIAKRFPEAKVAVNAGVIKVHWVNFVQSDEITIEFSSLDERLRMSSWRLNFYFPTSASIPKNLSLQNEISLEAQNESLSAAVRFGRNYLIDVGFDKVSQKQSVEWRDNKLFLNELVLAPWQSSQDQIHIDGHGAFLAINDMVVEFTLD